MMFFWFPLAYCSESIFEKDRWKRMPWWQLYLFFLSGEYLIQFYPQNEMSTNNVEITTDPYKGSVPRYWCFHWFSWQLCALCTSWASSEVDEASSLKDFSWSFFPEVFYKSRKDHPGLVRRDNSITKPSRGVKRYVDLVKVWGLTPRNRNVDMI